MSQRYKTLFAKLNKNREGAFVPFVTLGDPCYQQSLSIIDTLVSSGADALELGIPFSDPLADGPTIQNATVRALQNNISPDTCFELIQLIRLKYPSIPIGLLLYANLIVAAGRQNFYHKCSKAGVDSVLIADVPIEAASPFATAARQAQIDTIYIVPPNIDDPSLRLIAKQGRAYTYLLSRAGVTGTETAAGMPIDTIITKLKKYQAAPPLLGFGVSKPAQVKKAIAAGAAGVICGSAVVKIIEQNLGDSAQMLKRLRSFIKNMKRATKPVVRETA